MSNLELGILEQSRISRIHSSSLSTRLIRRYIIIFNLHILFSSPPIYIINQKGNSQNGDADLYFSLQDSKECKLGYNYVIISQKTKKINTYSITVVELSSKHYVYIYEKFQLWETMIRGILLKNNDFIMLAQDGLSFINLF